MNTTESSQDAMLEKLDMLICLAAHQASSSIHSMEAKAIFLRSIGMQPVDIAKILGTQPSSVRATLAKAKKKPKRGKGKSN